VATDRAAARRWHSEMARKAAAERPPQTVEQYRATLARLAAHGRVIDTKGPH
jgi:hypothetical protein